MRTAQAPVRQFISTIAICDLYRAILTYRLEDFENASPYFCTFLAKIVSEYDQEIPQSQTADSPVAPRGRATQPSRDTRKTN